MNYKIIRLCFNAPLPNLSCFGADIIILGREITTDTQQLYQVNEISYTLMNYTFILRSLKAYIINFGEKQ